MFCLKKEMKVFTKYKCKQICILPTGEFTAQCSGNKMLNITYASPNELQTAELNTGLW